MSAMVVDTIKIAQVIVASFLLATLLIEADSWFALIVVLILAFLLWLGGFWRSKRT
jgi:threonine/homoserine/homoserine lactone efflux protein